MSQRRRVIALGLAVAVMVVVAVAGWLLRTLPGHHSASARVAVAYPTRGDIPHPTRGVLPHPRRGVPPHPTAAGAASSRPNPGSSSSSGLGSGSGPGSGSGLGSGRRPGPVSTTVAADGGGPGAPVADLSRLTPVQEFNVSKVRSGPVRIGGTTYADSVRFTCDSGGHDSSGDLDYAVTGYRSMSAVLGIPDDVNAPGDSMTITFFNNGTGPQTSSPVVITPGHPHTVHLHFSASSQLEISCAAVNQAGTARYMQLALGNATFGP